jgi:hypothetical protein
MATMAKRLPIQPVPKEFYISLVALDVIYLRGRLNHAQLATINAQRIAVQEHFAFSFPSRHSIELSVCFGRHS